MQKYSPLPPPNKQSRREDDLNVSSGHNLLGIAMVVLMFLFAWWIFTWPRDGDNPLVLFDDVRSVELAGGVLSVGEDYADIHDSLDCILVCVERQNDISDEDTISTRVCRGPGQVFRLIVETMRGLEKWPIRAIELARPGPGAPPGRLVDRDEEMIRRERRDCVQRQQAIAERFDERRRRRERESY